MPRRCPSSTERSLSSRRNGRWRIAAAHVSVGVRRVDPEARVLGSWSKSSPRPWSVGAVQAMRSCSVKQGFAPTNGLQPTSLRSPNLRAPASTVQLRAQKSTNPRKCQFVVQRESPPRVRSFFAEAARAGRPIEISIRPPQDLKRGRIAARPRRFAHDRLESQWSLVLIDIGGALFSVTPSASSPRK